jgi:hypothetical protein
MLQLLADFPERPRSSGNFYAISDTWEIDDKTEGTFHIAARLQHNRSI